MPLLEVLIDVRLSECGIGTKVPPHSCRPVAGQDRIQYITPPVRAMYVPRTEHRPLAVTELVEHEQRVIARAPKVTVVRRSLLFSMYRTLRTVHVQDHPPVRCVRHRPVHPLSVHSAQPFDIAVLGKHLGLEPAHGVGAGGRSLRTTSPSNDDPHRRVLGQPFSVVGILVARQTTVHRLPEKAHQSCCTLRPPRLSCRHSLAVSVSPSASSNSRQASSPASEVMVAPRNSNRIRRSKRSLARAFVLSPIGCLRGQYVIKS